MNKASKKVLLEINMDLSGSVETDVTDWASQDLLDYMEDVTFGAVFEHDKNGIPIRRLVPFAASWEPYTVPWTMGIDNKNYKVCKDLQAKIH